MKCSFVTLSAVRALAVLASAGCGGSTDTAFTLETTDGGNAEAASQRDAAGGSAGAGNFIDSGMWSGSAGAPPVDASGTGGGGGGAGNLSSTDAGAGVVGDSSTISPQVIDGCSSLCAKEAMANCPNQGSTANCNAGCRLILRNPTCAAPSNALFACEEGSPAACDAQGRATLTSCAVEQLTVAACFLQNAADPTLVEPCAAYCAKVAAANCPNDDRAGCATNCSIAGNVLPACSAQWRANVTCGGTATFVCGADGKATASACNLQAGSFLVCALVGLVGIVDGGQ